MSKTNGFYNKYRKSQAQLHAARDQVKHLKMELREDKLEIKMKRELIATLSGGTRILAKALKPIEPIQYANQSDEQGTVIALLSDVHAEHKITLAQTNNVNKFNIDICTNRLTAYFNNMVKLTNIFRKDIQLDTLIWGWLGDMIHGFIHEEYLRTNYLTPIEASLYMTEMLGRGIEFVLNNGGFKRIVIVCKIGNHSRTTQKIYSDEEALHSHEWGIYKSLANKYPQVGWIIDESYFTYFGVYDKLLRFHHGHAFKYMGGIGGIQIPLMRFIAKVNRQRRADMDIIGHWHTRMFDATNGFIVNSSVCGPDPYSIRLGFPTEPPTQQYQILDYHRGFTINAPIMLE